MSRIRSFFEKAVQKEHPLTIQQHYAMGFGVGLQPIKE